MFIRIHCERCEDYPYSSLNALVYGREFAVPLHDSIGFKDKYMLNWINEKIEDDELQLLKQGLNRSELKTLKFRETRRTFVPATSKGATNPLVSQMLNQKSPGTF